MMISSYKKHDQFLACSIRQIVQCQLLQKYKICIEACKGFPWLAIRKKTLTPKLFAFHHTKTSSVEFFNTPNSLSSIVRSLFSLDIKKFFAQRAQAMRIFKCLFFLEEINIFCWLIW